MSSILTNNGAMVALQTMKSINKNLGGVQDMISTGKRVSNSKDNAAVWAISTVMQSDVSSFKAIGDSLALGQSTVSVARNASEQVKDLLVEMRTKIVASQEENVDRSKIQSDIEALRDQVKSVVGAAQFNGLSLLKGSDDVHVLSSIDRSASGTTATSSISVSRNNLDSGVAVTNGDVVINPVNDGAVATAELQDDATGDPSADGTRTLTGFTDKVTDLTFSTTVALDEGDTASFDFALGTDSITMTYEHTAGSTSTTTGQELAHQISEAYAKFKANVDVNDGSSDGDFVITQDDDGGYEATYTGTEGTITFTATSSSAAEALRHMSMTETAGVITVTNNRDTDVDITQGNEVDRADSNMPEPSATATNGGAALSVNLTAGTRGLQADDEYDFTLEDAANNILAINVTGASLDNIDLADTLYDALEGFKAGTYGTGINGGIETINGATVTFAYTNASINEAAFVDNLDGTTGTVLFQSTADGIFTIDNDSGSNFAVDGVLTIGSDNLLLPNIGLDTTTIDAGTVGDYATIDVDSASVQTGDKLSVTIAGVDDPITYTVTGDEADEDEIAANFSTAINTALTDAGIEAEAAVATGSSAITLKSFNNDPGSTLLVSNVTVVNEESEVASTGGATSIAADETETFSFKGRTVEEGDTYSITVGDTSVSYTATKNDDLNEVAKNLSGLLKLNTSDDLTVTFTASEDPTLDTNSITLDVKNNGTSALAMNATALSGGTAGGGMNLIDEISVLDNSKASGSLDIIDNLIQNAIDAAASFGSSEKRLEIQQEFIGKLTDSLNAGIGTLVDANMEETAARLQALQVQQQLGTQALSIANQAPQNILALFR